MYEQTGKGNSRVWWKHHILPVSEPVNTGCGIKNTANGGTPNITQKVEKKRVE